MMDLTPEDDPFATDFEREHRSVQRSICDEVLENLYLKRGKPPAPPKFPCSDEDYFAWCKQLSEHYRRG